jgi:hypothetical protein
LGVVLVLVMAVSSLPAEREGCDQGSSQLESL